MVDVSAAVFGLGITLPLYPFIALAIVAESPGPVFYSQRRAGTLLDRRPGDPPGLRFETFAMYKFRTMRVDAEAVTGAVVASEGDPRVTRIGRFLRRKRLDELPQLWNVLRGDMSLVGPRPERPELFERLAAAIPFFEERMRGVKPGITGYAQVSLDYTGKPAKNSALGALAGDLVNPFRLEEAAGALADDMRIKLLYDLAYCAALERFGTFVETELLVLFKTPFEMAFGGGR